MRVFNHSGQDITGMMPQLRDPLFGSFQNGRLRVNWESPSERVDERGFDKRICFANGNYKEEIALPVGTAICRYGNLFGRMTAPTGTDYECLSLPYDEQTVEYHEFIVVADGVRVACLVERGMVYPMFGMPGGGVQYLHSLSINEEVLSGKIKEVFSWKK